VHVLRRIRCNLEFLSGLRVTIYVKLCHAVFLGLESPFPILSRARNDQPTTFVRVFDGSEDAKIGSSVREDTC